MHPVWPCHCHHICFQLSIFPFCLLLLLLHGWWINQSSLYAQHSSQQISNVYFFSQIHSIGNSNWVISDWIQKSVQIQCFGWSFLVCYKYDPTFCGKYNLPPLPLKSDDVISGTLRSWGHLRPKISLVPICMKTNFWKLKSPKIYSLMTKNTKKCKKWYKNTFLHFLAIWPIDFAQFSPPLCAIWWVL